MTSNLAGNGLDDPTAASPLTSHNEASDIGKDDAIQLEILPKKSQTRPSNTDKENGVGAGECVEGEEDLAWMDDDDDDDDDNDDFTCGPGRALGRMIMALQRCVRFCWEGVHKVTRGYLLTVLFVLGYFVYFIIAMRYKSTDEGSHRLLGCTIIGLVIWSRHLIARLAKKVWKATTGSSTPSGKMERAIVRIKVVIRWLMYVALAAVMIYAIVSEGKEKPTNLRALPGLIGFIVLCLFFSTNPSKINWHTIYWSLGLQFLFAVYALKWQWGKESIIWTQDRLDEFFANAKAGSTLLFGETYTDHQLIFGALPSFIYTNAAIYVLYYIGAMQFVVKCLGNCLQFVLHTSPVESMSVAAGIFLEGLASIAALRPYMYSTTKSQLFLIMTSTFASLGGAYLALLSSISIQLEFLIAAMVISAPATFTVCKLLVPETKKIKQHSNVEVGEEEKNKYINLLDAAQAGAIAMLPIVSHAAVNAFASWSFVAWINSTLVWFGDRVGIHNLTVELISSYLFYPASLAMGIEPEDCRSVAMLLGYRLSSTNLVAFIKMMQMKGNRYQYLAYVSTTNGTVSHHKDDVILDLWNMTLKDGFISERSEAVAIYSLTGFSSFISAAILLGIMYSMLPTRKRWIAKATMPALFAGNIANCMTGCFASLFY